MICLQTCSQRILNPFVKTRNFSGTGKLKRVKDQQQQHMHILQL